MFGTIMIFIAEVIGCAIGIYLLAAFIVSLRRLLPFLAIGAAVATILVINNMNKQIAENGFQLSYLLLPIIMSLLMMLFFQGDGFMNPRVSRNLFSLVSVERKWESFFEDDDTYVLHFSPAETGGFIENVVFQGILFFCIYYFLVVPYPASWWGYIIPIYVLGMSVLDVLAVFGIIVPNLLSIFIAILMFIVSVGAGIIGSINAGKYKYDSVFTSDLYEQCLPLSDIDFSVSYKATYTEKPLYGTETLYRYLYDADRDVAAFYDLKNGNFVIKSVAVCEPNFNGKRVWLDNVGTDSPRFVFSSFAVDNGAPCKYSRLGEVFAPYRDYYKFSEDIFFNHTFGHSSDNSLTMSYTNKLANGENEYMVSYSFDMTDGVPYALSEMSFRIYLSDEFYYEMSYSPMEGSSGLEEYVNPDHTVNGYTYDPSEILISESNDNILKYLFENDLSSYSDETISAAVEKALCPKITSSPGFAGRFDFEFQYREDYESIYDKPVYIHDAQSNTLFATDYNSMDWCKYNISTNGDNPLYYRLWPQFFAVFEVKNSDNHIKVDTHNEPYNTYLTASETPYKYGDEIFTEFIEEAFYDIKQVSNVNVDKENLILTFEAGLTFKTEYKLKLSLTNGIYKVDEYSLKSPYNYYLTIYTYEKYDLSANVYVDEYRPQN